MLQGKIESISQVPDKENYTVAISLPQGMNSTPQQTAWLRPYLQGETEIITEDLRLLERVFYQFRKWVRVANSSAQPVAFLRIRSSMRFKRSMYFSRLIV